ncbi:MAG: hypothetical protein MUE40_10060 [Anaerolineae bacterium]|nr:hypothetical protein [Anaerolineae bacterium]
MTTVPLWVTRFGWGTAEGNALLAPNPRENGYLSFNSPAEQATYIPRAFQIGQESGDIGTMFLYNLNGCQANNGEACFYSLIDSSSAARPVFSALQSAVATPAPAPVEATAEATAEVTVTVTVSP